jgi:hypothetical protein
VRILSCCNLFQHLAAALASSSTPRVAMTLSTVDYYNAGAEL